MHALPLQAFGFENPGIRTPDPLGNRLPPLVTNMALPKRLSTTVTGLNRYPIHRCLFGRSLMVGVVRHFWVLVQL